VLDWATQLSNYFEGRFQLSVFSYSARAHPVLSYAAFVGSKRRNAAVQWDDPEARRLLGAATRARTDAEQQRIYDSLHRRMVDQIPIIGLYNEPSSDLVRADVHGYRNWPAGNPRLWGVWRTGA
jgi:peptide/nickel transport system substrate-binding protein